LFRRGGIGGLFQPLHPWRHSPRCRVRLYRNGAPRFADFEENLFDGDENAIVDFKYSNSPKLTWWFDHHQSAFLTAADAASSKRALAAQDVRSFLQILHQLYPRDGSAQVGYTAPDLDNLVHWPHH